MIFRSVPQKVKLENVTLAQWSVANMAILYKLVGEGKLHAGNSLDCLSYTTKICQLLQKYSLISLWLCDREYRKLQVSMTSGGGQKFLTYNVSNRRAGFVNCIKIQPRSKNKMNTCTFAFIHSFTHRGNTNPKWYEI